LSFIGVRKSTRNPALAVVSWWPRLPIGRRAEWRELPCDFLNTSSTAATVADRKPTILNWAIVDVAGLRESGGEPNTSIAAKSEGGLCPRERREAGNGLPCERGMTSPIRKSGGEGE